MVCNFVIIMIYLLPLFCLMRLGQCQEPESANFVLNIDSELEACNAESAAIVDTSSIDVVQHNESVSMMSGQVELLVDVPCNVMVRVSLMKEEYGQRQMAGTHEIYNIDEELKKGPESDYYVILKYIDIPPSCPFKAGKYEIKDLTVNADELPLDCNTCGSYQAILELIEVPNGKLIFCLTITVIVETV